MILLVYMMFVLNGEPQTEVIDNAATYADCYTTYVAAATERAKELNIPVGVFKMGCGTFPLIVPK